MIKKRIDNQKGFQIYVITNLIFSIFVILILILTIRGLIIGEWSFISIPFFILIAIIILFGLIDSALKPSYIEIILDEREIVIKTFNFNNRNFLSFIFLLRYKKNLKELKMSKQEYNNYKLLIDRFGLRKHLIIQKINKDGIYETSKINISLLGQKKYTNLILSIDRLMSKINLN